MLVRSGLGFGDLVLVLGLFQIFSRDHYSKLFSIDKIVSSLRFGIPDIGRYKMGVYIDHTTSECKSLSQFLNVPEAHVYAFNSYRANNSSYSNNYSPNMRNHPYLS
jgi:hypothetical protein